MSTKFTAALFIVNIVAAAVATTLIFDLGGVKASVAFAVYMTFKWLMDAVYHATEPI